MKTQKSYCKLVQNHEYLCSHDTVLTSPDFKTACAEYLSKGIYNMLRIQYYEFIYDNGKLVAAFNGFMDKRLAEYVVANS